MSRRVLSILLALSVALNVSFVAGFLYVGRQLRALRTPEGRADRVAGIIGLDAAQREAFLRRHGEWRSELERVQRARQAETDAFWQAAVQDEPDRDAVQARLVPLLEAQRETTASGVDHLLRIFRGLTRAQREALADMLRKKQQP